MMVNIYFSLALVDSFVFLSYIPVLSPVSELIQIYTGVCGGGGGSHGKPL